MPAMHIDNLVVRQCSAYYAHAVQWLGMAKEWDKNAYPLWHQAVLYWNHCEGLLNGQSAT